MEQIKLAIKDNNLMKDEPCAICGEIVSPRLGLCIFMADNYRVVCDECAGKYAPRMLEIVKQGY